MTLIKSSAPLARIAAFGSLPKLTAGNDGDPVGLPEPGPEQREIEALSGQVASLEAELADLRVNWDKALAEAGERARDVAARAHVRNDGERLTELREALGGARSAFADWLQSQTADLARSIAGRAFGRLAALRQDDQDWIARLVARRIDSLGDGAVIAAHVPQGLLAGGSIDDFEALMPGGTRVEIDGSGNGIVRIELVLGEIAVDPSGGIARVAAQLEGD